MRNIYTKLLVVAGVVLVAEEWWRGRAIVRAFELVPRTASNVVKYGGQAPAV
jgi:hypothetical protein